MPRIVGRPFPKDQHQRSDREAEPQDRETVALQTRDVGKDVQGAPWQRNLIDQVMNRRGTKETLFARDRYSRLLARHLNVRQAKVVLSISQSVLVRTADWIGGDLERPVQMQALLHAEGPHACVAETGVPLGDPMPADGTSYLEELVTALTFEVPDDQLPGLVDLLHDNGFDASLDHVVPLNNGVVMKRAGAIKAFVPPSPDSVLPAPGPPTGKPIVALVDTGINRDARTDGWLQGIAETKDNRDPLDVFPIGPLGPTPDGRLDFGAGHGTFVAGIIAQISPDTPITVYRAIDSDGIGSEVTVAASIVQAADEGAGIINLSLGTETLDDHPPLALTVALEILARRHPDVVLVAAAGNSGSGELCWPAAFPGVVGVAALNADLSEAQWSNYGPWVDFCTVGQGIRSTYVPGTEAPDMVGGPDGDTFDPSFLWGLGTGTSFAAPQISGALARLVTEGTCSSPRAAVRYLRTLAPDAHNGFGVPALLLSGVTP